MKRTPLRRRGRERGKPIPAFRAWIRKQRCAVIVHGVDAAFDGLCGMSWYAATEVAHLPRVKQWGDKSNCLPLCGAHHREQHTIGVKSFAHKYRMDLEALAVWYWERYEAEG